ncbi:hypothetical protein Bbelb_426740, partial [Branchiostoma belcheri]
ICEPSTPEDPLPSRGAESPSNLSRGETTFNNWERTKPEKYPGSALPAKETHSWSMLSGWNVGHQSHTGRRLFEPECNMTFQRGERMWGFKSLPVLPIFGNAVSTLGETNPEKGEFLLSCLDMRHTPLDGTIGQSLSGVFHQGQQMISVSGVEPLQEFLYILDYWRDQQGGLSCCISWDVIGPVEFHQGKAHAPIWSSLLPEDHPTLPALSPEIVTCQSLVQAAMV